MPVIDASLLVAATTDAGAEGIWAEEIVAAGNLVAPHLVLVETANILRRLEAAGHLTKLEATAAHRDVLRLDLELVPYEPVADRVWELRANLTSYDAWYVALAEALDLPLATLDARMSRAPGPECEFLVPTG
ncbi:MAG: type II toxin-antitoxin system VapC family toxin [Acidobacteria bacterium]|nr:type II toxin-antitoxin system VapC family toxin [Acidobacteriota bacterium]